MNQAAATTSPAEPIQITVPDGDPREQVRIIMEGDAAMSQARVAREVGLSATTFSQYLNNSYAGNYDNCHAKVRVWLEAFYTKLANGGLPAAPDWIDTPTSRELLSALRYAQIAADVALIAGGPGLGKTKTIQRYAGQMPNVWVATMRPSRGGVLHTVQSIAVALGLRKEDDASGRAVYISNQIVKKLRGTGGLLVVDESQHCNILALEEIRSIQDAAEIGLAVVGNNNLYSRSASGVNAPMLDRLLSRVGKRVTLGQATPADVDTVLDAWGIKGGECRTMLHAIAKRPGALRTLTKVMRLAKSLAVAESKPLCCEHVKAAWAELGGAQ